jgi:hypothetical protein
MWSFWARPAKDGFPKGFRKQRIEVSAALSVCDLDPEQIVAHFRSNPEPARHLLEESEDKRYTPSTFFSEEYSGYSVGWYSAKSRYECVHRFSTLEDAATDYLLFSLGKGRWTPPEASTSTGDAAAHQG